jgi:probable HAF family extracellular repeat protein
VTAPLYLGTLGGAAAQPYGVNSDGSVVVGYSAPTGDTTYHAFRWTSSSGMQDLGTFGGSHSLANGVNSDGSVVVGYAYTTDNPVEYHAFRWTSLSGMQDLGTLGGGIYSIANGVNSDGSVVVGGASPAGPAGSNLAFHAFRWTSLSGMQDLGTLGNPGATAYGVNSDGSVVVGAANTTTATDAFRWTSLSGMQDLGTLGGTVSQANGVNSDGSVVVGAASPTGVSGNVATHAFRWTSSSGMQDLGTLGGTFAQANGVNSDGSVVVGLALTTGNANSVAFRWTAATGLKDLNVLLSAAGVNMTGINLTLAQGVSNNGFIVGIAQSVPGGDNHAYLVRYDDGTGATATPAQQIAALEALIESFNAKQGIDNSLDAKLNAAEAALAAVGQNSTVTACDALGAFINETQAQSGKALTGAQSNQLVTGALQIQATLRCS